MVRGSADNVRGSVPDVDPIARFRNDVERLIDRVRGGAGRAPGAPLALAISGGPDSMAMLALAAGAPPVTPRGVVRAARAVSRSTRRVS